MSDWTFALQASALSLSVLWLLLGLRGRRQRSAMEWVWLLFCASAAMFSLKRLAAEELGAAQYLVGLGACFTCNAFWLVARGMFRPQRDAIGQLPLVFAAVIAGLLMLRQLLQFGGAIGLWSPDASTRMAAALGELTGMLGSTVLVLAFWEGVRGWSAVSRAERRVRIWYLAAYGGCVLGTSALARLFGPAGQVEAETLLESVALLAILFVAQALVWWRLRHPLVVEVHEPDAPTALAVRQSAVVEAPAAVSTPIRSDERDLAARLEAMVRERRLYLEPELKLVHLAQALDVSEYRISRAITGALGERNINRWLHQWRVRHAQQLLRAPGQKTRSVLEIALESGFASLGPFNRAFKELTGVTPGAYRAGNDRPLVEDRIALDA